MSRQSSILCVVLAASLLAKAGCVPQQPFYFHGNGDLSHYIGKATDIEFPDVETTSLDEVVGARPPLTLDNPDPEEIWELPLEEAVRIALANGNVIRTLPGLEFGQTDATPETIQNNPAGMPSVYDPALTETGNGFSSPLGVEAALADFDTTFNSFVRWDKNNRRQNVSPSVEFFRPTTLEREGGSFQAELSKPTATGGTWYLRHNVDYEGNNTPLTGQAFHSAWTTSLEAEFSMPLLQGNGVQFTRIYGPRQTSAFGNAASLAGRAPEQFRGVMIARLNADVSLADFEAQVLRMIADVEHAYWNLYLAYRNLDALVEGRNLALDTWRDVQAEREVGTGDAQDEAQARHQYFEFKGAVEEAQNQVYVAEGNLRYMMGLAATDGRLIRPSDEPTTAEVQFDWADVHAEAMARSVNLRRQKWQIKRRELQLIASKNLLLPELNAGGMYRWHGLGDRLIDPSNARDNAYGVMTGGDFQEWSLALNLSVPLGFRKELAGVRNAELQLTRDRAVLREMELELSHDLSGVLRDLKKNYQLAQTRFNQRLAAQIELEGWQAQEEAGLAVRQAYLDRKLDAQRRLATAEINYYSALVAYNKAILQVHFRKGSLLEYNGVYLAEGPWPAKAYFDAVRRARARDASTYLDYGFTRPKVISRGEYQQHTGTSAGIFDGYEPTGREPVLAPTPETIPVPEPEPMPPTASRGSLSPRAAAGQPLSPQQIVRNTSPRTTPAAWAQRASGRPAAKYDLGTFARGLIEGTANDEASPSAGSAIEQASYQEATPAPATDAPAEPSSGWTSAGKATPAARASTATAARPAPATGSGWKSKR